ncbi:TPM domain-containing protein [Thermaurantiacus sp.]
MRLLDLLRLPTLLLAVALALPGAAETFPPLTGRVVDAANLLPADAEARIEAKLAALEAATGGRGKGTQLVVATIPDLGGLEIEDYGYRLGRHWGIGQKATSNGAILLVAPNDRKVRIEVGYGLEPVLTDALSKLIIEERIVPAFRAGDFPAGIEAGTDALIRQLELPPDEAEKVAAQAASRAATEAEGPGIGGFIFLLLLLLWLWWVFRRDGGQVARQRMGPGGPIVIWGPGSTSWGGGFGGRGFGGGFGGGGGGFGGGGASGGW